MRATFNTKLIVPVRRNGTLRRERLLTRLNDAAPGGVAVIKSPAGFGKTTLLVDFCEQAPGSIFWLSLDEWDRDWRTLATYLLLTTSRGKQAGDEQQLSDPSATTAEVVEHLTAAGDRAYLVLDDLHVLHSAPEAIEAIDLLLRRIPANTTALIASRTSPGVPSLAKLRVSGALVEIGQAELVFHPDEVRQVWNSLQATELSGPHLRSLLQVTGGWPAAVSLACRSGELAHGRYADDDGLTSYLSAEVVGRLPDRLSRFLLRSSVLDVLDPEACSRLDQGTTARQAAIALHALDANAIPLSWLSTATPRITLHPLLRDFLLDRLRTDNPEDYVGLQIAAGEISAERGAIGAAVHHFAASERWPRLAELIEREAPAAYSHGRWTTILAWLHAVPEGERASRPGLALWECRILSRLGRTDQALQRVEQGMHGFLGSDTSLAAEFETVKAEALRTRGDIGQAVEAARRAKDLAFASNASFQVLCHARRELGVGLMVQGEFTEAIEELSAVLALETERGDTGETAYLHGVLGSSYGALGRLAESVHHLERARQKWEELGNNKELAWSLNNLGVTYWQLGRDADARGALLDCVGRARESGNRRAEGFALVSMADIDRYAGELDAAATGYHDALAIGRELGEQALQTFALVGLADVERKTKGPTAAAALVEEASASAETRGATFEKGLAVSVRARIKQQLGEKQESIESFMLADRLFDQIGAAKEQAENLLLLAAALLPSRADRTLLSSSLSRIPHLVEAAGSDSLLRRHEEELRSVAKYAVARRVASNFYRPLLRLGDRAIRDWVTERDGHPRVTVTALGEFMVTVNGHRVERVEWEGDKSKEMLLLLLLTDRPLTRDEIIETLWPEHPATRATSVFHSTLHRVRRAVPESVVEFDGAYVVHPQGSFEIDALDFRMALRSAGQSRHSSAKIAALTTACSIYGGQLAPRVRGHWLEAERAQLEREFVAAAKQLAGQRLADAPEAAALLFQRVLHLEPYDEDACLGAMRALGAAGDDLAALAVYERYETAIKTDLGLTPGNGLQALYRQIRRD